MFFHPRSASWSRLDNAAKIFPSTSERTDTRVFRFYCELTEDIDPEILQEAAELAANAFPGFLCIMRRGLFWYYLEHCSLRPEVKEENLPVCHAIYDEAATGLLFRISYRKRRINLEVYHVLCDGTGALSFLREIVYQYLILRYPDEYTEPPANANDGTASHKSDDSFRRYYSPKDAEGESPRIKKAFNLKGEFTPDNRLAVTEGTVSVKKLLEAAHKYETTMTVFLTALFMDSIHKEMPLSEMKYPMVIGVPVNLRPYFPSETARNFFGMITVSYDFSKRSGEFSDIVSSVSESFRHELTKERLAVRMNKMASLEHNIPARLAPLPFKNFVLRTARHIKDKGETAVISNMGAVKMPPEMAGHIDMFGVLISTLKLQMCICSFGDKLQIGFTSGYTDTDIQRSFFRRLTENGIDVTIRSNNFFAEEVQNDAAAQKTRRKKNKKDR